MFSVREVAELLSVSPETIRRLAAEGELVAIRVGGQLRFEPEAVSSFIAQNRGRKDPIRE